MTRRWCHQVHMFCFIAGETPTTCLPFLRISLMIYLFLLLMICLLVRATPPPVQRLVVMRSMVEVALVFLVTRLCAVFLVILTWTLTNRFLVNLLYQQLYGLNFINSPFFNFFKILFLNILTK